MKCMISKPRCPLKNVKFMAPWSGVQDLRCDHNDPIGKNYKF